MGRAEGVQAGYGVLTQDPKADSSVKVKRGMGSGRLGIHVVGGEREGHVDDGPGRCLIEILSPLLGGR